MADEDTDVGVADAVETAAMNVPEQNTFPAIQEGPRCHYPSRTAAFQIISQETSRLIAECDGYNDYIASMEGDDDRSDGVFRDDGDCCSRRLESPDASASKGPKKKQSFQQLSQKTNRILDECDDYISRMDEDCESHCVTNSPEKYSEPLVQRSISSETSHVRSGNDRTCSPLDKDLESWTSQADPPEEHSEPPLRRSLSNEMLHVPSSNDRTRPDLESIVQHSLPYGPGANGSRMRTLGDDLPRGQRPNDVGPRRRSFNDANAQGASGWLMQDEVWPVAVDASEIDVDIHHAVCGTHRSKRLAVLTTILATLVGLASLALGLSESKDEINASFLRGDDKPMIPIGSQLTIRTRIDGHPITDAMTSYGRSHGWHGRTHRQAREFCTSRGTRLCPYEAICPFGPGSAAASASPRMTWVATSDADNSWVQTARRDSCLKYDFMHNGNDPEWGITGEESEEITREVFCCSGYDDGAGVGKAGAPSATAIAETVEIPDLDPRWHSVADEGWRGVDHLTWNKAREFCLSTNDGREQRFPCQYEVYCPKGPHRPPAASVDDRTDEVAPAMFAPILNEQGYGAVQLTSDGEDKGADNVCKVRYHVEDGVRALENEFQLLTHVMCCRTPS